MTAQKQETADIYVAVKGLLGSFELDVAFTAPLQGVTALFGPSGCGKTTILRAIAGLDRLTALVRIGDDIWQDVHFFLPVHHRPIGYVFQEASLFPHLDVRANLTFGMDKKNLHIHPSFDEVVAILGLEHLIKRAPHHLSGGERQRVAIGRALLSSPKLLLMDEPLSALDQAMREEIMPFLIALRVQLQLPIFYITHDRQEVERLADYLICLEKGRLVAAGALPEIQANPSLPLARAREAAVNLDAVLQDFDEKTGLGRFAVKGGDFLSPIASGFKGQKRRLRIGASDVSLVLEKPKGSSILNSLPVRILSVSAVGRREGGSHEGRSHEMLVVLALGVEGAGAHILSRISTHSWHALHLHEGMQLYAQIKGVSLLPGD